MFLLALSAAGVSSAQDADVLCPGDARCPASMPVQDLPQTPTVAADQALGFRPTASREGVNDGQLEQQAYQSQDGATRRIVTSNTPVPNPGRERPRRAE